MRLRLFLSFILIVLVAIISVALIARRQTVTAVNAFIFRGGLSGTEGLVKNLEEYYALNDGWEGVEIVFRRQGRGMGLGQGQNNNAGLNDQRLQFADANGLILADTKDDSPSGRFSLLDRNRAIKLEVDGYVVGYLLPETMSQISQIATEALVTRINKAAFTAAILASVVALALALFLSYRLLRPVGELTWAAEKLAAGDLSQRVPVRGGDELATLANSFNHMAASLQLAETQRRALTADIAHELRTPLAVQRAHLEALEDGIYDLTLESLKPIEEHNHLLTRLVDDLRTLALADSGQLELVRTPTDISALIKRVIFRLEPQAVERQIHIQASLEESPPSLSLDSQRIEQILHNLLDNAMRFTPDGGVIHVQCSVEGDQCLLTVRDNGPGIPPDDLIQIFERFYRADKARSRADGGTGLGLSIARKIAQAHSGDLTAENHPDGGAVFNLFLTID
ncbi:ATP-binding protein [Chloroflexota bacterium]